MFIQVFKNWKHSTRHKARKVALELQSGGLNKMSPLLDVEIRALKLWGGVLIDGNQVNAFGLADDDDVDEEPELKFVPTLNNAIEDYDVVFDVLSRSKSKKTGGMYLHTTTKSTYIYFLYSMQTKANMKGSEQSVHLLCSIPFMSSF